MERGGERQKSVEALLSQEKQKLQFLSKRLGIGPELNTLCKRLGIKPDDSEWVTWALVGMVLAREQREFTGKPLGRGRPRKLGVDSLDAKRAQFIEDAKAFAREHYGRSLSAKKLISFFAGEVPLFPNTDDLQPLRNSVARGNRKLKAHREAMAGNRLVNPSGRKITEK
jgi:hypothetical protein